LSKSLDILVNVNLTARSRAIGVLVFWIRLSSWVRSAHGTEEDHKEGFQKDIQELHPNPLGDFRLLLLDYDWGWVLLRWHQYVRGGCEGSD
jgi:hypothetical protein